MTNPLRMGFVEAVCGKEIYNFFNNRIIEHTASTGDVLAVKVRMPATMEWSEADTVQYAAANGVLAPNVRGIYDIVTRKPIARVLVTERVPGVPLASIWLDLDEAQKASFKDQLRAQLARMRACTQPLSGESGASVCKTPTTVYKRHTADRLPMRRHSISGV